MQYIFKTIVTLSLLLHIIGKGESSYQDIMILLLLLCATLLTGELRGYWKYIGLIIEGALVMIAMVQGNATGSLAYIAFDILYTEKYVFSAIIIPIVLIVDDAFLMLTDHLLIIGLAVFSAVVLRVLEKRNLFYRNILDSERRARYELETVRTKLIATNQEIERLTEVKERNRIARDLHDSLGHSIAGVLIQLQAGERFIHKDQQKSEEILKQCIHNLQNTLTSLRDTVHGMYRVEKMGLRLIQMILDQYTYCPIKTDFEGDFSSVPETVFEGLSWVVKEALTNTAKHSGANSVYIEMKLNQKLLRLYIQDNGRGCKSYGEGLGIRSMSDRIKLLGGILSADGLEGFRIVCTIPIERSQHETTDRR